MLLNTSQKFPRAQWWHYSAVPGFKPATFRVLSLRAAFSTICFSSLLCGQSWIRASLFQVFLALGTLILITGLTMLTVGYVTAPKIEAFGEDDLLFTDSRAATFNRALEACKLAGAVVFCIGGSVMAGGFLLSVSAEGNAKQERGLWRRLAQRLPEPVTRAPAPRESKIPVTLSKVQNVQPTSGT